MIHLAKLIATTIASDMHARQMSVLSCLPVWIDRRSGIQVFCCLEIDAIQEDKTASPYGTCTLGPHRGRVRKGPSNAIYSLW